MLKSALAWVPKGKDVRSPLMAAFSYLGVLCFVPLLFNRDDPFVSFHARQGFVIWICGVLALLALSLPGFGWFFRLSASLIATLSLAGLVAVALHKTWKFPIIHGLSEKL